MDETYRPLHREPAQSRRVPEAASAGGHTCLASSSVIVTACGCTCSHVCKLNMSRGMLRTHAASHRIGIRCRRTHKRETVLYVQRRQPKALRRILEPVSIKARDSVCSGPAAPALAAPSKALGEGINLIVVPTGKSEQLSNEFLKPSSALGKTD